MKKIFYIIKEHFLIDPILRGINNIPIKFIFLFFFIIIIYINIKHIEIDNKIILYEKNINYSNCTTDIKTIALYLPQFHSINENDKWWGKGFTEWHNVRKAKTFYEGHHQPRIPGDKLEYLGYYDLTNIETIKKQIKLAKSHGIYGFGIYYYWFSGKRLLEKPLDIFLNNKNIEFKFLLIWANENWTRRWDGLDSIILIKQEYKENDPINFIKDIKKYLMDKRYIRINSKPIIGLYEPKKMIDLNGTISKWRNEAKKNRIGEIFILVSLNNYNFEEMKNINLFDGVYEFSPRDSLKYFVKYKPYLLYTSILYKNIDFINITNDFPLYRGSMLEFDNSPRKKKPAIFEYYSPEQFYMLNKKIIEWTRKHYNLTNRFIFINAWNEWGEGAYLEPDEKYGYASLNSLSKALFNKSYGKMYFNHSFFNEISIIGIQAHIYYDDLINEIINKTNNIPFKFDLYISTNSISKKNIIEKYIKKYSKAELFEIKIVENKGRDILPFLNQMKNIIKKYKYICHIYSKKEIYTNIIDEHRNYLLENLLGNKIIILEILSDFENNNKLGFIFPENYYKILFQLDRKIYRLNRYFMNVLSKNILNKFKIRKNFEIPIGNMFWAKVSAIFQIFNKEFQYKLSQNFINKDAAILNEFKAILLVIINLNGYYYKKIFKHF